MIYPKTFEDKIGFNEIRTLLRERCLSSLGKEEVDKITFMDNVKAINTQLSRVREFRRLQEEEENFPLNYFFDVRQSVARLRLEGTHMEEDELFDLRPLRWSGTAAAAFRRAVRASRFAMWSPRNPRRSAPAFHRSWDSSKEPAA